MTPKSLQTSKNKKHLRMSDPGLSLELPVNCFKIRGKLLNRFNRGNILCSMQLSLSSKIPNNRISSNQLSQNNQPPKPQYPDSCPSKNPRRVCCNLTEFKFYNNPRLTKVNHNSKSPWSNHPNPNGINPIKNLLNQNLHINPPPQYNKHNNPIKRTNQSNNLLCNRDQTVWNLFSMLGFRNCLNSNRNYSLSK